MYEDVKKVLISRQEISKRVEKLGKQISEEYAGKDLILVCILRGSAIFCADLCREITVPIKLDFMAISSYGSEASSSGEVRLVKDLNFKIDGAHVLIIEDIIDSGYTIRYLKEMLGARNPASIKVCTLLDKLERRKVNVSADYIGFSIPNEFIIGYGLDYAEKYRNLPEICVLDPKIYS